MLAREHVPEIIPDRPGWDTLRAMEDERALFLAWCDGDKKAGAALFDRHYEPLARFFHNKVDESASSDLVQATFLACTEARARFRGDSTFRTFLFAIAHNLLRGHYKARRREAARVLFADAARSALPPESEDTPDFAEMCSADLAPSPSSLFRANEEQRLVLEGLRRIPIECQEVLELHYWEHMETTEIADIIGVPQGTVKSRLQRGRRILAEKLERLTTSKSVLESTLSDLDGWARGLRERLERKGP